MARYTKNFINDHMPAIIFGLCVITLSVISTKYGVSKGTAWIVAICTTLVSVSVIIIKKHITDVASDLLIKFEERIARYNDLISHVSKLEGIAHEHGKKIVDETISKLKEISDGKIFLDQETYYDHINKCMRETKKDSTVLALNCIDSLRWSKDAHQVRYLNENKKAAERGVKIHRIFLIEKSSLTNKDSEERIKNIEEHLNCTNIVTDIVWTEELTGFKTELEDMVIFNCSEERLYIDYPDISKRTDVSHAYLYLCKKTIGEKVSVFNKLHNYVLSDTELNKVLTNKDYISAD
jgi:hypothetical protein